MVIFDGFLCAGAKEVVQVYAFCIHTLHLPVVSVTIIKVVQQKGPVY